MAARICRELDLRSQASGPALEAGLTHETGAPRMPIPFAVKTIACGRRPRIGESSRLPMQGEFVRRPFRSQIRVSYFAHRLSPR